MTHTKLVFRGTFGHILVAYIKKVVCQLRSVLKKKEKQGKLWLTDRLVSLGEMILTQDALLTGMGICSQISTMQFSCYVTVLRSRECYTTTPLWLIIAERFSRNIPEQFSVLRFQYIIFLNFKKRKIFQQLTARNFLRVLSRKLEREKENTKTIWTIK